MRYRDSSTVDFLGGRGISDFGKPGWDYKKSRFYVPMAPPAAAAAPGPGVLDYAKDFASDYLLKPAQGLLSAGSAAAGGLAGLGAAAFGSDAYQRALDENAGTDIGPGDAYNPLTAMRVAPGPGQVLSEAFAPGEQESVPGRLGKRVGALVGDIALDPMNWATGGLAATSKLGKFARTGERVVEEIAPFLKGGAEAARTLTRGEAAGRAATAALGSASAGLVYAPDIVKGTANDVQETAQAIREGDWARAAEHGAGALLTAGLGGATLYGVRHEFKQAPRAAPQQGEVGVSRQEADAILGLKPTPPPQPALPQVFDQTPPPTFDRTGPTPEPTTVPGFSQAAPPPVWDAPVPQGFEAPQVVGGPNPRPDVDFDLSPEAVAMNPADVAQERAFLQPDQAAAADAEQLRLTREYLTSRPEVLAAQSVGGALAPPGTPRLGDRPPDPVPIPPELATVSPRAAQAAAEVGAVGTPTPERYPGGRGLTEASTRDGAEVQRLQSMVERIPPGDLGRRLRFYQRERMAESAAVIEQEMVRRGQAAQPTPTLTTYEQLSDPEKHAIGVAGLKIGDVNAMTVEKAREFVAPLLNRRAPEAPVELRPETVEPPVPTEDRRSDAVFDRRAEEPTVGVRPALDRRTSGPEDRRRVAEELALPEDHPAVERVLSAESDANTDVLTGLPNRRALDQALKTHKGPVISADLGGLGFVNDNLGGHPAGDAFIRAAAEAMREEPGIRAYRAGDKADEFAWLADTDEVAEAAAASVQQRFANAEFTGTIDGKPVRFTGGRIDYGIGTEGQTAADRLKHGDDRLYESRQAAVEAGLRAGTKGARPVGLREVPGSRLAEDQAPAPPDALGEPKYSAKPKAPAFYSALQRAVEQKIPPAGGPSAQILKTLQNTQGVKPDEIKWTGLDDFLAARPRASRDEILQHLRENAVEVKEVTKGGAADPLKAKAEALAERLDAAREEAFAGLGQLDRANAPNWAFDAARGNDAALIKINDLPVSDKQKEAILHYGALAEESHTINEQRLSERQEHNAKFSQYTLPGGENYRELLLTLPAKNEPVAFPDFKTWRDEEIDEIFHTPQHEAADRRVYESDRQRAQDKADAANRAGDFRSSHYDEPNILAHVRFNERTDADGKRVLFIEEIQSDWAQKGRREGFKRATEAEDLEANTSLAAVPQAPFVDSTEKWTALASKRILRYAAENGFDRVAWTTGEQQAARYDLSQQVQSIEVFGRTDARTGERTRSVEIRLHDSGAPLELGVDKNGIVDNVSPTAKEMKGKPLADVIGKEMADRIMATDKHTRFDGEALRVGGEGMKGYYDKILPGVFEKLGKKWGAKVGETRLKANPEGQREFAVNGAGLDAEGNQLYGVFPFVRDQHGNLDTGDPVSTHLKHWDAVADAEAREKTAGYNTRAHSLDVTDSMRRSVMEEGQPLFRAAEKGATAREGVDLPTIQHAFPSGKVSEAEGGFVVDLPHGRQIRVTPGAEIEYRPEAMKAGYGRELGEAEEIVGSWQKIDRGGLIQLAKAGDAGTLNHEVFHSAMDLVLSPKEKAAVLRRYGSEEKAADAYAAWKPSETNTLFSKIAEFFRRIYNSFKPSWESAFKEVRSGKAFERKGETPSGEPKYSAESTDKDAVKIVEGRFEFTRGKVRAEGGGQASNWFATEAEARADLDKMRSAAERVGQHTKAEAEAVERAKAGQATPKDVALLSGGRRQMTHRQAQGLLRDLDLHGKAMEAELRKVPARISASGDSMRDVEALIARAAEYHAAQSKQPDIKFATAPKAPPSSEPERKPLRPIPPSPEQKATYAAGKEEGGRTTGKPPAEFVNLDRASSDEDIRKLISRVADAREKEQGEAKSYRSWEEAREKAVEAGITEADFKRMVKEGAVSDHVIEAGRMLRTDAFKSVQENLRALNEAAKDGKDTGDLEAEYESAINKAAGVLWSTTRAGAEAGRALAIHRKLAEGLTEQERLYRKIAKGRPGLSEGFARRVLATDTNDSAALSALLRSEFTPSKRSMAYEFWINGLLSGPPTHFANAVGNTLSQLGRIGEKAVAGGIDAARVAVFGGERERFVGEAMADIQGIKDGLPKAMRAFSSSWNDELLAFKDEGKVEYAPKIPGKAGKIIRTPTRMLTASDQFAKAIVATREARALAYRKARMEGKTGNAIPQRMAEILGDLDAHPDIAKGMAAEADYQTFTKTVGKFGQMLRAARDADPTGFAKVVVPFFNTPLNIAKYTLERTPLNFIRIAAMAKKGELKGGALSEELAKATTGTMIGIGLAMMANEGLITGGGPADPKENETKRKTGWAPYSLHIGDQYISMQRLEPFSSIAGFAADMVEAKDEKTTGDLVDKIVGSVAENLTNKTFLQGLENAFLMWSDPKRYASQWAKNLEGSVVPAVFGRAAQAIDPTFRETSAFDGSAIAARIPGVSTLLQPRRTGTGEPVERGGTAAERFLSPAARTTEKGPEADLERVFLEVDYVPSRPAKSVTVPGSGGKKVELTDAEYREFQKADERITQRLRKMVADPRFRRMSTEAQRKLIKSRYELAGDDARRRVLPSVVKRFRQSHATGSV